MSRLSRIALSKRSVTLLFAGALFIAGISAWGSLKQELLPDIDFPIVTIVTPFPGAGSSDVTEQVTKPIENAVSGVARLEIVQSTSSNSISLVIAQFSYGTNVKDTTAAINEAIAKANLPETATPTVQALNINASPVVVSSIASTGTGGLEGVAEIARTEIVPELEAIEGVARVDLTGGLEQRLFVTLDPAKLATAGITSQQVVEHPPGQQPDRPVRPDPDRRLQGAGVDHRLVHVRGPDPRPRGRVHQASSGGPDGPGRQRRRHPPARACRLPSRRSRSPSAPSGPSGPNSSPRPASGGPTATRR